MKKNFASSWLFTRIRRSQYISYRPPYTQNQCTYNITVTYPSISFFRTHKTQRNQSWP